MTLKHQREYDLGHIFDRRSQGLPRLLSVSDAMYRHPGLNIKIVRPFWIMDYTHTAGGRYKAGFRSRRWLDRPAGVAHLYPPGCPFWEDTRAIGCRVHSSAITFHDGEFAGLDRLTSNRRGFARFLDPKGMLGDEMMATARIGGGRGAAGFWQAHGIFYSILNLLLASEPVEEETRRIVGPGAPPAEAPLIVEVRQFLEHHLSEPVSLELIAGHLGMSTSSLSHRYKAATGEAPMAARMRLALNTVKRMLLKGYPLKQIAEQTGFCDLYHLSKAFKRHEGLSPRAFLRRQDPPDRVSVPWIKPDSRQKTSANFPWLGRKNPGSIQPEHNGWKAQRPKSRAPAP